jgi:uncharacterized protein (TIGR02594 family)
VTGPAGFVPVPHAGRTIWVMPDYYKRGGVRIPVDVAEAERIRREMSQELGVTLSLPTAAMVDSIWRAADVKLAPHPLTDRNTGNPRFYESGPGGMTDPKWIAFHNDIIETQLGGRTGLIAGHKKDILRNPARGKVRIYGWHQSNGRPIQPDSNPHGADYADYSHGLRLVYDPGARVHGIIGEPSMAQNNPDILSAAGAYLGLEEWPGAASNPAVDKMFEDVGHGWADDSTPWCAAFVGSVLASLGLPHTGKLNARSYENYGSKVSIQNAQPGDIVVFWRGSPSSWQGHVAFLVRFDGNKVIVRGGNQGNKVSDAPYPIDRIVAIRRADGVEAEGKRPVLREGDRGAFVLDLQNQLTTLGYTLGKQDGIFGSRTLSAVVAFQADSDLTADGIVGPRTWGALADGEPRAERDVAEGDLAGRSRTYDTAASGKNVATIGGAVATATVAISEAQNVVAVAQEAEGVLEQIGTIAPSVLAVIAVAVVAYFAWRHFDKIRAIRLEDARTGRNDGV